MVNCYPASAYGVINELIVNTFQDLKCYNQVLFSKFLSIDAFQEVLRNIYSTYYIIAIEPLFLNVR